MLLGIDVGTSGTKALVVDAKGAIRARALESYPFAIPRPGWAEQDPELWWEAARRTVRAVLAEVDAGTIRAVGLSGQMHGLVALDAAKAVIRPAILWNDQRPRAEVEEILERVGGLDALLALTNNAMLTGYTAPKILWLKAHEPESFARLRHVLNPKDWLRLKLTGELATDVSEASGTGLFDVRRRDWSKPLLDRLDLALDLLPPACESHEVTGYLSAEAAADLGLPPGIPVTGGGGDAVIQTSGTGILKEGVAQTIIGTAGIAAAALTACPDNEGGRLQLFCNNAPGTWHAMGVAQSAGAGFAWTRRLLGLEGESFEALTAMAGGVAPGGEGLIFLPYLQGERCPHPDPDARGVLLGLTLHHGRAHVVRAVMEGVVMAIADMLALMRPLGLVFEQMRASGGGAASPLWRQIQADVLGVEVVTMAGAAEGGAYGAALTAGVGIGVWPSLAAASAGLPVVTRTEPIAANLPVYAERFAHYQTLYPKLAPDMHRLAQGA